VGRDAPPHLHEQLVSAVIDAITDDRFIEWDPAMYATALFIDSQSRHYPFVEEFLNGRGIRLNLVATAQQSLAAISVQTPDVIFCDLNLPDRDGISLLAELQRLLPTAGLVAMTDRPTLESAVEALRNGACDYLFKPVSPQKVWAAWERAARRKQGITISATGTVPPAPAVLETPSPDNQATVTVPLQGDYKEVERTLVRQVILRFDGNKTAAAKALGMHRKTLYRVLDRETE